MDDLATRFATCEILHGYSFELTNLKVDIADLWKDVDYLKSKNITSPFDVVDYIDNLVNLQFSLTTTGEVHRDVAIGEVWR